MTGSVNTRLTPLVLLHQQVDGLAGAPEGSRDRGVSCALGCVLKETATSTAGGGGGGIQKLVDGLAGAVSLFSPRMQNGLQCFAVKWQVHLGRRGVGDASKRESSQTREGRGRRGPVPCLPRSAAPHLPHLLYRQRGSRSTRSMPVSPCMHIQCDSVHDTEMSGARSSACPNRLQQQHRRGERLACGWLT